MFKPYGFIISISILICILVLRKLSEKKNEDVLWGLVFWTVISGIIGARIYHVVDYISYYKTSPLSIFMVWNGGLGIWGADAGGILGSIIYLKKKRENVFYWLDHISVVIPLGQSIGRWANFFNHELFGKPTNLPWGIFISKQYRPLIYRDISKYHPLFLYESILNFFLFLLLLILYKKIHGKTQSGIFLFLYLAGYSVIRFFLEFLRIDPWKFTLGNSLTLNVSQCISILVLIVSIVFIGLKFRRVNK